MNTPVKISYEQIENLKPNQIIVFASNLDGLHNQSAASWCCDKFGAVYGIGIGMSGKNCYALPLWLFPSRPLDYDDIFDHLETLFKYIEKEKTKTFIFTALDKDFVIRRVPELKELLEAMRSKYNVDDRVYWPKFMFA